MARWGKCDFRELERLKEKLDKFSEADYDKIAEECCQKLAQILYRRAVKDTPVDTGHLKGSWQTSNAIKRGGEWRIAVYNTANYALYVEYGHRSRGGGWVSGRFMLTTAEKYVDSIAAKTIENKIKQKLGEIFG